MEMIRNPLLASIPCGRLFGVRFRISLLSIGVALALLFGSDAKPFTKKVASGDSNAGPSSQIGMTPAATLSGPAADEQSGIEGSATVSTDRTANEAAPPFEASVVNEPAVDTNLTASKPASSTSAVPESTARPLAFTAPSGSSSVDRQTVNDSGTPSAERPLGPMADRLAVGLFLALVLIGSTMLHQIGEILVASRAMAGLQYAVLLPVGGHTRFRSTDPMTEMVVAAVGPVIHLGLCLLALPAVITSGETGAFSLFSLPLVTFHEHWFASAGLLIFGLNWKLLFINLIPLMPLDCARFVAAWRRTAKGGDTEPTMTAMFWARLSLVGALALFTISLTYGNPWLVGLAGVIMAWSCVDGFLAISGEGDDERVFGYDFSEGYTSLERDGLGAEDDVQAIPREKTLGPIARWKAKKDAQKRQREREEREWAERELDRLLDKVGKVGMDGLTPEERATLQKVSSRYKQ